MAVAIDIFVSWDGDGIGRLAGQARLSDDVGEVRRVSAAIEAGNEVWKSFALSVGGQIVEIGGDEGAIQIGPDRLPDLADVARRYQEAAGATASVGVGTKLSESSKALAVAKIRGKNRILLWQPSMQAELAAVAAHPQTEAEKLGDEYPTAGLSKAVVAGNEGDDAGFSGHSVPTRTAPIAPGGTQASPEEDPAPAAPAEASGQPADLEEFLHQAAASQGGDDASAEQENARAVEALRGKLVAILGAARAQLPALAQLRTAAPDAYAAVMGLIQGVVALGRKVVGQPAAAPLSKSVAKLTPKGEVDDGVADYSHLLPQPAREAGLKLGVAHVVGVGPLTGTRSERLRAEVTHDGREVGSVGAVVRRGAKDRYIEPHSELESPYRGQKIGQAMYEALYAHARNVHGIKRVTGGFHLEAAHRVHVALASKHGFAYRSAHDPTDEDLPDGKGGKGASKQYPYGKYSYTIKSEVEDESAMIGPGRGVTFEADEPAHTEKDELGAGAGTRGGGAAVAQHHHLNLPVGSQVDQKVKVRHSDGKESWVQVGAGQIVAQDADSPVLGANSHPISSRRPNSR